MSIVSPFPKPIRSLFKWTANYKETLYLLPTSGEIQLGSDMVDYPIEASLYWLNGRIVLHVAVGPKGFTLENARERGLVAFGKVELGEHSTTRDVWAMARAMCLVLLGGIVEVTEVRRNPETGVSTYPVMAWMTEMGRGTCPECKTQLPWLPAFPVNAVRRCPACRAIMVHRDGLLDVKASTEAES